MNRRAFLAGLLGTVATPLLPDHEAGVVEQRWREMTPKEVDRWCMRYARAVWNQMNLHHSILERL